MKREVKKYHLHDPKQVEDDIEYWRTKSAEEKILALEEIRFTWNKINKIPDEDQQRLRRVIRIVKQK
jgi:hypothetical protein